MRLTEGEPGVEAERRGPGVEGLVGGDGLFTAEQQGEEEGRGRSAAGEQAVERRGEERAEGQSDVTYSVVLCRESIVSHSSLASAISRRIGWPSSSVSSSSPSSSSSELAAAPAAHRRPAGCLVTRRRRRTTTDPSSLPSTAAGRARIPQSSPRPLAFAHHHAARPCAE